MRKTLFIILFLFSNAVIAQEVICDGFANVTYSWAETLRDHAKLTKDQASKKIVGDTVASLKAHPDMLNEKQLKQMWKATSKGIDIVWDMKKTPLESGQEMFDWCLSELQEKL